ncbi:hypothetical protein DM01DRAFT_1286543 [Hesseltinella vesiculosa]|uniref:CCHC-type domain-containing protein n=1 Tax=Hesseltinella vesiculosa TaxID=101127 RepID=A0A1X2GJE5_9FUNG|nr:hypothetical protein DM01DRAFT_1286543 [Hesseltinella vesiculosa]
MNTVHGLKIAYLSGIFNQGNDDDSILAYDQADVDKLRSANFQQNVPYGVDLLLTTEWPEGIQQGSANTPSSSLQTVSRPIAQLALGLKPRYHFADSEHVFYEREPYTTVMGFGGANERPANHVTRFLGLGDALNKNKQRWFYAYNLVPMSKATPDILSTQPTSTTDCPFWELTQANSGKRDHPDNGTYFWGDNQPRKRQGPPEGYVCKICNEPGHFIKDCPQKSVPRNDYICRVCNQPGHFVQDCPNKGAAPDLRSCWFCLSNPDIEKHLIGSIGENVYLTLAKGPLVAPSTCPVSGGGHVLLIAINHYPDFGRAPDDIKQEVETELKQYKDGLRQYFDSFGYEMVTYQIAREPHRGMAHAHMQILAVPKNLSDHIEQVAQQEAKMAGFNLATHRSDEDHDYFEMELPNGKRLIHALSPKERFNLQFGRLVLANALDTPDRMDWKACAQGMEEEKQACKEFKAAFKKFDFSLD